MVGVLLVGTLGWAGVRFFAIIVLTLLWLFLGYETWVGFWGKPRDQQDTVKITKTRPDL